MNIKINNRIKSFLLALATSSIVTTTAFALPLELSDEPLFLNQSVPPALAVTFDDSGSMSRGYMPDSNSFSGSKPSTASPDYNSIYYNPATEYKPPVLQDGSSLPNSIYTAAQFDGFYLGGNTSSDLGEAINLSNNYEMVWTIFPNYGNGNSSRSFRSAGSPSSGEGYYYTWNGPGDPTRNGSKGSGPGEYTIHLMNSANATEKTNFANWYTYYNTRNKLAKSAVSHAFVGFGPDFKIDWQQLNRLSFNPTGTNMNLFDGAHRADFYTWLYEINAGSGTPLRAATERAGLLFTKGGVNGPYYDPIYSQELSCQQNFHISISDGSWNSAEGVSTNVDNTAISLPPIDGLIKNYPGDLTAASIPNFYSDNRAKTLADNAFAFWANDLRTDLDNDVPSFLDSYTDSNNNIISLASGVNWWENNELFWNPMNDPATWQHMVNFNIGLGVIGLFDPDTDIPNLRNGNISSWTSTTTAEGKIDDVFHAALNSRGKFLSARSPQELADALDDVISNIINRKGRASAGSVSSSIISDSALAFRTGYDTSDWTGYVTALKVEQDGTLGAVEWDASCKLTGGACTSMIGDPIISATRDNTSRIIFTYEKVGSVGTQHLFKYGEFSSSEIAKMQNSAFYSNAMANPIPPTFKDFVDYIRGDRTYEQQFSGSFRNRNSLLGDVIHSSAKLIRGPGESYNDDYWYDGSPEADARDAGDGYLEFKLDKKDRDNVILVGANDGMLHAFDAGINTTDGGTELWAYIPSSSLDGISELANPVIKHKSYVDAAPVIKDAFINGNWTTTAVGGLRHGGKLFYALDLGDQPSDKPAVLWEFSDIDDPDMGFSYAGAVVTRVVAPLGSSDLQSKWVAFVPNGYNSNSHKSVLYALDLETGKVLHKWNTNLGTTALPNGMGPPTAADYIAYDKSNTTNIAHGADQGTDFIYSGDLYGNIYRFDTTKIFTNPAGTSQPHTLYAGDPTRPITVAPRLFTQGSGSENIVVTFGTGKYLELPDRAITTIKQHLIGVKDKYKSTITHSLGGLIEQFITESGQSRTLTNNHVGVDEGWKVALPENGERLVNSIYRDNKSKLMIVATIIPNGIDPCAPGGKSWLMALDALSGGSPSSGPLLLGGTSDGQSIGDIVTGINVMNPPGGNNTFITVDTINPDPNGIPPIDLGTGEKWQRRSWHRIIFD